jgi:hypothetical protein
MSLPVIEGPVHELAIQCPLEVEPPELPVVPDLVVASQHFFEGPIFFPAPPLDVPVSGQQNLPPPARLEVPQFGKRDVWPESYAGIDTLQGWLPKKRRRIS